RAGAYHLRDGALSAYCRGYFLRPYSNTIIFPYDILNRQVENHSIRNAQRGELMNPHKTVTVTLAVMTFVAITITVMGQEGRGPGQGAPPAANLPQNPTAVPLPSISEPITGPGPMYDSTPSLAPGKGLVTFKYEAREYFISGTANGQPYKT